MKLLERVGAVVTFFALWIFIAFVTGIVTRPLYEAFMFGFRVWAD